VVSLVNPEMVPLQRSGNGRDDKSSHWRIFLKAQQRLRVRHQYGGSFSEYVVTLDRGRM
jgi:hypothetical protein